MLQYICQPFNEYFIEGEKRTEINTSKAKKKKLIDNSDTEEEGVEEGEVIEEDFSEDKEPSSDDNSFNDGFDIVDDLFKTKSSTRKRKTSAKSCLKVKAVMPHTSMSNYEKVQAKNIAEKRKAFEEIFMNDK